ncbi:MAG: hypothetical protein KKD66_27030 [Proteobacteria bacterium]|nr:hypothetical protein [Pseudomonadota bacterium]
MFIVGHGEDEVQMDSMIIAAIIGAIGAVAAAVLGMVISRRRDKPVVSAGEDAVKKANTFRIGFESGMLDYLEALRISTMWSAAGDEGITIQVRNIQTLARVLGITDIPEEASRILRGLSDHFMKTGLSSRRTYDIGFNIAVGFGTGIIMQVAAVPGRLNEVEQLALNTLQKTESALKDAELTKGFLSPVKRLWKDLSRQIGDGNHDIAVMTSTMRQCVEDLALKIEREK